MSSEKWPRAVRVGNVTTKVYRMRHASAASGWTYVLAYHEGGIRKRQKFADPVDAVAEARVKAEQLNAGRVEGASMTRGDRDELQAARALVGGSTVLAALKEWARARDLTGGHVIAAAEAWKARNVAKIARKKIPDVVAEFCRAKTKAGFNVADDHSSIFDSIKADFAEQFIDTVGARALDTWLAKRENPVSRNTYRKRVVSVWRWAQKRGYLPRDVKTEAELTERAREVAPDIGIINVATWARFLEMIRASDPNLIPVAVVAGFCGLRRAEIHGQTWEDINLENKFLRVTRSKRGTPARRLVPLCDAAVEWLMLYPDRKGVICEGMGLDRSRKLAREATPKIDLPENCFRHSFISHRVAQTGNIPEVSIEAGNSPQIINRHYRELVTKAEGEGWFAVRPSAAGQAFTMDGKAVANA